MSKSKLIIIGAGQHALSCIDVIESEKKYLISGLVGLPWEKNGERFGYPIIGGDDDLNILFKDNLYALIAIGQLYQSYIRKQIFEKLQRIGYKFPIIVAPDAYVSARAIIGKGSVVMHGATVNAGARIGNNCIINSNALIEHDVFVGDHCHISTGALLNGGVQVAAGAFIGSGSVLKHSISIGEGCVVGMGLSVKYSLPSNTILKSNE
jgi:sugar O-acyltransferase (sialic acid O-acetyltransferase NeuD family)